MKHFNIIKLIRIILLNLIFLIFLTTNAIGNNNISKYKHASKRPKKIILLIADGMGTNELGLLDLAWESAIKNGFAPIRESSYIKVLRDGKLSLVSVKPSSFLVADSACSSSSISSGKSCLPETIGFDENLNPVESFSEFAKKSDITLGLVSDTKLTHATPAGFYARVKSRHEHNKIAKQFTSSDISLALSGGLINFDNSIIKTLNKKGVKVVYNSQSLEETSKLPVLGLFEKKSMPDAFNENSSELIPSLLKLSKNALRLFKNENRYLLMIESGQIDWASHQNDSGYLLREMLKFETLLNYLIEYQNENQDVIILVLSDHSTGGFSFSYRRKDKLNKSIKKSKKYNSRHDFLNEKILDELFLQKISLLEISKLIEQSDNNRNEINKIIKKYIKPDLDEELVNYLLDQNQAIEVFPFCFKKQAHYTEDDEPLSLCILRNYLDNKRGIVWSTGTHTTNLVPLLILDKNNLLLENSDLPSNLPEVGQMIRKFYE